MKKLLFLVFLASFRIAQTAEMYNFSLVLPLSQTQKLKVNITENDPVLQTSFKELIDEAYKSKKAYGITTYECLGFPHQHKVADTEAFNKWFISNNGKDPVTQKKIFAPSIQQFLVESNGDIFRVPKNLKRKNKNIQTDENPHPTKKLQISSGFSAMQNLSLNGQSVIRWMKISDLREQLTKSDQ
jgi:hypothetical protein